jgi:hypothetical protein
MEFQIKRWVEFTFNIGCPNRCRCCPQQLLISRYFRDDKKRKSFIDVENFKNMLANVPRDIEIVFGAFSEAFVHPDAIDMIEYAANRGYKMHMFTTLRGLNAANVPRLKNIPMASYTVHLPDLVGNYTLPADDEYLEKLDAFHKLNLPHAEYMFLESSNPAEKKTIDEKIRRTLGGGGIFSYAPNDRAGTLTDEKLAKKSVSDNRKIICLRRLCNTKTKARPTCAEQLIFLPDGTAVPCCMDWGIRHPLGNILTQTYEEIINGPAMRRFEDAMMGKNNDDTICRHCVNAIDWNKKKWNNFKKTGKYEIAAGKNHLRRLLKHLGLKKWGHL